MQDKVPSCSSVENRLENASRDWQSSQAQPLGTRRGTAGKDLLDLSRLSWMDFGLRTPRQGLSNEAKALDQERENSSRQKVWKTGMCLCWVLLLKAARAGLFPLILLPFQGFLLPAGTSHCLFHAHGTGFLLPGSIPGQLSFGNCLGDSPAKDR